MLPSVPAPIILSIYSLPVAVLTSYICMSFVEVSKGCFLVDDDVLKTRLIQSRETTSQCQGGKKREQSNAKRLTAGTEQDSEAGDLSFAVYYIYCT